MPTRPAVLPQLDERAVASGTTVRFVLLVGLLVVSSADMMLNAVTALSGTTPVGNIGCALAAGADPVHSTDLATIEAGMRQGAAYQACRARFQAPLPWWLTLLWPVLLVVLAGLLFWLLPRWKLRRTVPLDTVDHDRSIIRTLEKLRQRTGLDTLPTVVVDRPAPSATAVVFGSDRKPILCLHGGLLARRTSSRSAFDAVLLHELGHVRNRDITVTYVAVAVWRVFVALVLLPDVAGTVWVFVLDRNSLAWNTEAPAIARNVVLAVCLVALVYLARSDVLRTREIYADRCALRWGASPRIWAVAAGTARPTRGVERAWVSLRELWRTHPRWELRRDALDSSEILFGVPGLPIFLAGAAADVGISDLRGDLSDYHADGVVVRMAVLLVAAALVAAVAGIALWRAELHATLLSRPAPSGIVTGLWLGAGMAVAELVSGNTVVYQWFPSRPAVLLLLVAIGVAFAWWTTRCSRLWIAVWRGSTIWPVIVLVLAGGGFALAAWLGWWQDQGVIFANGAPLDLNTLGPDTKPAADHSILIVLMAQAVDLAAQPLILAAVAVLVALPLLAWLVRPTSATPTWIHGILRTGAELVSFPARPPLGRVLVAGALGGVAGWLAQAGLQVYLHHQLISGGPLPANHGLAIMFCVLVAWLLAAMAGAAIGAHAGGRHRLMVALIAAEVAIVVSFAGQLLLTGFDGCVGPLATMQNSCAWRPGPILPTFSFLLGPALVLGFVLAFWVAAVVLGIRHAWQPGARLAADRVGQRRDLLRRLGVGVLCVVLVGAAVTANVILSGEGTSTAEAATTSTNGLSDQPVSTQTRASQVAYWNERGGNDLMRRFIATSDGLYSALDGSPGGIAGTALRPYCANYDQIARDAAAYFHVPDPDGQLLWQTFVAQVRTLGTDCDRAAGAPSTDRINTTLGDVGKAVDAADSFENELGVLLPNG